MEWKEYYIDQICETLVSGGDAAKYDCVSEIDSNHQIPVFANAIDRDGLYGYTDKSVIKEDAVTIAARGAGTGFVAFRKGQFVPIVRLIAIVPQKDIADARYLSYYFKICNFRGDGSAIPQITIPQIKKERIVLPPLASQRRIAAILSSLDRKIELNNKINAQLEELAQTLFKHWFVDFGPFKDGKFVESELGMIPEGWRVGTWANLTINITEKVRNRTDVKVMSPVTTGELVLSEEYFTKQVFSKSIAKYKLVKRGDFAYNPARVNIGSLGRNEFEFDGCVSPVYVVFSTITEYENYFDLTRKQDSFKSSVMSLAIGGVRQSLSYEDFCRIVTIIPPVDVVRSFNKVFNEIKNKISLN